MPLAIPLLLILTAFVAYASATLQHSQSTGFVGWLTGKLASLPILGGLSVKQVLKLDRWMTSMIGRHFKQVEQYAVRWLSGLDQFTRRNAKAALSLGAPVWALAYWLVHTEIGRQAKAHDRPIAKTANHALAIGERLQAGAIPHKTTEVIQKNTKTVTRVERVVMPHAAEWEWINHHWQGLKHAISLAAAGVLAPTLPRVKPISWPWGLTPTAIRRRLHRVEGLLGVTGMAVAIAAVLRVTPRCLTSGNIGRAARGLCRAPTWLLDVLLLSSFEAFAVADMCSLIAAEVKLAEWFQPLLMDLVSVDEWLIQNCGYSKAPDLTLPALSFPNVRYGVTLNGERDYTLGLAA